MKYVSIDIETLGLEPEVCDVIEFGAVLEDTTLPLERLQSFHCYVLPPSREVNGKNYTFYRGEPFAIQMHSGIIERVAKREKDETIAKSYQFLHPNNVGWMFLEWLYSQGFRGDYSKPLKIKVAGKNFEGFDQRFLRRLPDFERRIQIHHRVHNPAELYFDPAKDDDLPSLDTCLRRAGIDAKVRHSAVSDAFDVIRVLRYKWGIKNELSLSHLQT
jgi:DNA polymerase III epsilon subunit-like protein